jgi:hypothetical protein
MVSGNPNSLAEAKEAHTDEEKQKGGIIPQAPQQGLARSSQFKVQSCQT